jgi:hypothetical protein
MLVDMIKKVKTQSTEHNINQLTHNTTTNVNTQGNTIANSFWVIDSGATDHVCNNLSFFINHHAISAIHINLRNVGFSVACISRTISLCDNLYLHDVLYIEGFHFNIFSVHKVTDSLDLEITFNKRSCVLQYGLKQRTIGSYLRFDFTLSHT